MANNNDNLKYGLAHIFKENKEIYEKINNSYKEFTTKIIFILGGCLIFALIIISILVLYDKCKNPEFKTKLNNMLGGGNSYENYPPEIIQLFYAYKAYQQQQQYLQYHNMFGGGFMPPLINYNGSQQNIKQIENKENA